MTRKLLLALILAFVAPAGADTFTATYNELALSPANYETTWYSGDKVLAVWPTAGPAEPRFAALYDPTTKAWTTLDPGDGWGNTGMMHSSGKLILMGGGINGPADHNKQVWIGTLG